VNAAWDLAAHDLSIFDYWLGRPAVSVTARGECYLHEPVHDVVMASYAYPGGVLATVHTSWLNPRKVREITVVGEKKMVVWNDMDLIEPVRVYDKSVNPEQEPAYADSFGAARMIIRDGDVLIPKVPGGEPLQEECRHFVECIRDGVKPINDAVMATHVVKALAATDESMRRRGAEVAIEPGTTAAATRIVELVAAGV
jgi:predicted dehydrogenase